MTTKTTLTTSSIISSALIYVAMADGHFTLTDLMFVEATIASFARDSRGDLSLVNLWAATEYYSLLEEGRKGPAAIMDQIAYWAWQQTEKAA